MSGMKPMGYLVTEHNTGRVVFTKHPPSPEDMSEYELTRTTIYTADQLAEAVAAEREKNAKVCDELSDQWGKCRNPKLSDAQYWEGKSNAALDCAEAIRSAAK